MRRARLPLPPKLAYSALVALVLPAYLVHHGWQNLLWFSDVALLALFLALWWEHRLTASMVAAGTLLFELAWLLDWALGLILGDAPLGITAYMFDPTIPLFLRLLSLFHLALPPVTLWLLYHLGYDRRTLLPTIAAAWIVLLLTWLLTSPQANINFAFGLVRRQHDLPELVYLGLLMATVAVAVIWPSHAVLRRLFPHDPPRRR